MRSRVTMHTHVGYRDIGYIHGPRLYGHADYRGKRHALNGGENIYSGAVYTALCGVHVAAKHDGERFNVWATPKGMGPMAGVTCKRCLAIAKAEQES